jgi:hypothetical protein
VKLRREGNDVRAEGYFSRAYELAKTPRTAAQLGLVELAIGEFAEAEARLSEALGARSAWVAEHKETLEKSLALARKNLVRVELTPVPEGATYAMGGGEPRPVPSDGALWVSAGKAVVVRVASPDQEPVELRIEGKAGETRTVAFPGSAASTPARALAAPAPPPPETIATVPPREALPVPAPPAAPSAPPEDGGGGDGRGAKIGGAVLAGVGVASAIAGVVLYAKGSSKLDEYRRAVNSDGQIPWNPDDENWKTMQTAGIVAIAAGGAAIVGGAALFLLAGPTAPRAEGVAFVASPHAAGLCYHGAF